MKEDLKNMKEVLKAIQEMQKVSSSKKEKTSSGTTLITGLLIFLISSFCMFAWGTFCVVTVLRWMDVI